MIRTTWRPAAVWLLILTLIVLHHDFWLWNRIEPLLWGWAPIALWYHVGYTLVCIAAMYLLGRWIWPAPPEIERAGHAEPPTGFPNISADEGSERSRPS